MTKAEKRVSKLAEETKLTKKVAAAILDSLVKTLQAGLKKGVKIRIGGLVCLPWQTGRPARV